MKKALLKFLSFLLVITVLTGFADWYGTGMQVSAEVPENTASLEEDTEDFIPVYTIEDLYNIRNDLEANYRLMNDIDLTEATAEGGDWDFEGRGWNPIGSDNIYAADKIFSGIFDGDGHTIIGMRIDTNNSRPQGSSNIYAGLFSNLSGEVRNLNLINCNISIYNSPDKIYVGSLAAKSSGKISNCIVSGTVKSQSSYGDSSYAGGLIGFNTGIIFDCGSSVNVSSSGTTFSYAGGIAAYNRNIESEISFHNCFNEGMVYATATVTSVSQGTVLMHAFAGGIIGENTNGIVSQCYNNGHVEAEVSTSQSKYSDFRAFAGGIVGQSEYGLTTYHQIITRSYNTGNVSAVAQYPYAGGIAGTCDEAKNCYNLGVTSENNGSISAGYGIAMSSHGVFENCYYLSESGDNFEGTTALTQAQMKLKSMYQGFDFDEVWTIAPCSEYPYPQLRENLQAPANHTFGDWQIRKAATCTAKGEEYRVCVCGEEETREISPLGHSFTEYVPDNNATCMENGTETAKCDRCDVTDTRVIENSTTEHNYSSEWTVDKEPTCTEPGSKSHHCIVCGAMTDITEIPAAHTFGSWEEKTPPTCHTNGTNIRTCSECGYSEEKTVPMIPHNYVTTIIPPTENSQGYSLHTCSVCGNNYKDHYTDYVGEDVPQIVIESKSATAGETITVNLFVKNNPAFNAASIKIDYDATRLQLISAELSEEFSNGTTVSYDNLPYLTFVRGSNIDSDTNMLALTFKILDTAVPGDAYISLLYDEGNISNIDEEDVNFKIVEGKITVMDYLPGDINGDGSVNTKDLTRLLKYINHEDVEYVEKALDVNADGDVNTKDLTRLLKYINHEDVEIF